MVRAVADRAFLPTKNLLEQVGDMMILTGKTLLSALRPPVPVRRRVHQPVPVRPAAVLVPAADLDDRVRLRRAGTAGRQLPGAVRRARPPRRLLRAGVDPRVRAVRDGDHPRRRGRHGHHRRPRRAQDPRGARRPPGARRRPGQEPRRAALPGADDRDRAVQHLRAAVRHLRRRARHDDLRRAARPVLLDAAHQREYHRPLGQRRQDHPVRGDHRDRLLLQGHDRLRRRRGSGPRREPGRGHLLPRASSRSTTSSRRRCSPPIPKSR